MSSSRGPKSQVRSVAEKVTRRAALWGSDAVAASSAVDLVVTGAVQAGALKGTADPVAAVEFLRSSWAPDVVSVACVRAPHEEPADPRLATLLDTLASDLPAFGYDRALELCRASDALSARREPFVRPRFAADAGLHAKIASSYAKKGRVLTALVRFLQPQHVIEIGTAYGMSALFLATELPPGGTVVTVEASHPQVDIAREVLNGQSQVQVIEGFSHDVVDQVAVAVPQASLLFHDGAHSAEAYVRDFTDYLPLLAPGAVVLFDDIRWDDPRWQQGESDTYAGWQQLVRHEAVRSAYELDGELGLLQLR